MNAFELAAKLKLDSSGFASSLGDQESAFKKFGEKLEKAAGDIGKAAFTLLKNGITSFTKDSIKEGLDFDKAMAQVAATLGVSVDEVQQLSAFAREMGSKTAFSATEAAQALNYMALAGYDADKSMKMLPIVLNLAAAGGIDLAKASDMVTDAQSALGLSMDETVKMVDQMARTSSKTNTSVEQLGDAFLTVGGTAKMMARGGIDTTTELSMALGVLADNGIKGAEGGTMLRNILLSLSAPTDKAAKMLNKLGIEVFDADGSMRDLPFILQDITEATKDMTQEQRTEFLSEVFNKRDLKAIEALLGTDMSRWEELYGEIFGAEGAAEAMAETQLYNLAGDLTIFRSTLSEARLSLSEKLTPALRKFVQSGTAWVSRLTKAFNQRGLGGALSESRTILRGLVTDALGLDADARWTDIGIAAANKLKEGLRTGIDTAKVKLANLLGLVDENGKPVDDASDTSWTAIASAALGKITGGFSTALGTAKVTLATLLGMTDDNGKVIDDPADTSWAAIAGVAFSRITEGFSTAAGVAKVKLANLLGLTDESGKAVDDPSDTSWEAIAQAAFDKVKTGFETVSGMAKVRIANLLGLTDEAGNAVDDPSDTSWGAIAQTAFDKIKTGFTTATGAAKVRLANLLGLTDDKGQAISDPADTTWSAIASNAFDRIKEGFTTAVGAGKVKLANWLGLTDENGNAVDDANDTSWTTIAESIQGKLRGGFKALNVKLTDLLGITPETAGGEADWEDIGREIMTRLTSYFSRSGDFLKKLILGDEFVPPDELTEGSTWLDVGKKISGWLEEAFADGGILNAILGNAGEKAKAIAEFGGQLMAGFADWLNSNSDILHDIITSLANAAAEAAEPIVNTLVGIMKDPRLWTAAANVLKGIIRAVLGQNLADALLGTEEEVDARTPYSEIAASGNAEQYVYGKYGETEQSKRLLQQYYEMMGNEISGRSVTKNQWQKFIKALEEAEDAIIEMPEGLSEAGQKAFEKYGISSDSWKAFTRTFEKAGGKVTANKEVVNGVEVVKDYTVELGGVDINVNPEINGFDLSAFVSHILEQLGINLPSNAKGLWDVPYDNYFTKLHRDEMVLTASQAREYRNGGGGDNAAIVEAIRGLRTDLTQLQIVVGEKVFGRTVVRYSGRRMNDYIGGAEDRQAAGYGWG